MALLSGAALYFVAAHLIPLLLTGALSHALEPAMRMTGYMMAAACGVGAGAGLIGRFMEIRLYARQQSLEQIRSLSWSDFERLIAETFRREGYRATLTDPGPDGGIDVILTKSGARYLVQCKHWRTECIGVKPVRELAGIVAAAGANGGVFVCSGSYTAEAVEFACRAGVRLIDGAALARMMRLPDHEAPSPSAASCPRCGNGLVQRVARRGPGAGTTFLGCSAFPKCRFTRGL